MCGRLNISDFRGIEALLELVAGQLPLPEGLSPGFNLGPGAQIPALMLYQGPLRLELMEWGLVPRWAKPGQFKRPLFNARAETAWDKPAFRQAMRAQRIVVTANGFYEWQQTASGKQPFHFTARQWPGLLLAGLFDFDTEGKPCACLLTTGANGTMQPVHDRMPVILAPAQVLPWLGDADRSTLQAMTTACPDSWLQAQAVSSYVSNSRNQGPRCIEPLTGTGAE